METGTAGRCTDMQLIRGTAITLYTGNQSEVIENVLIGEPSGGGYTLGIPKGDAHDWIDRKIGFFGEIWRTVGTPVQGIEANIPLCWHKKVCVEPLKITGAVTIYSAENYTRHQIDGAYYQDLRGETVQKTGEKAAGGLFVHLYCVNNAYTPKIGDIVIIGECPLTVDTASEQTVSAGVAALRAYSPAVIRTVTAEAIGIAPDYNIEAR